MSQSDTPAERAPGAPDASAASAGTTSPLDRDAAPVDPARTTALPDEDVRTVDVGEIIRIVDPELDVEAIMAEIRANLAGRPPLDPDPSGLVYRAGEAALLSAQSELEWEVEQALECQRDVSIGDQLRPGAGVVGELATRFKRPLHQLVRFYVDLLIRKQSALDGHVVRALQLLSQRAATAQDDNARLRAEVEQLRRDVAALSQATRDRESDA